MSVRNPIITEIVRWGNANANKIDQAYDFKGGWEGWVQVELAIHLRGFFGGQYVAISREDLVYGNKQRSDILFQTDIPMDVKNKVPAQKFSNMIELKCESKAGAAAFPGQVKEDCEKVTQANIVAAVLPCKAWVVAFSVTKVLTNLSVGGTNLQLYPDAIQLPSGRTVSIYWGAKSF